MRMLRWSAIVLTSVLATFATAQTHDHSAMNTSADGQFNPYVVSDNQGGFYLAYVERKGGFSNVMLQHSSQSGGFSAPVRVNPRASDGAVRNENPPKIAVGPDKEVYVVWASERERWKGNIRFARSMNGGKTFEPAIDLNSDATQRPISRAFQSIAVDAKGRIFVVWIDERNKTADGSRRRDLDIHISNNFAGASSTTLYVIRSTDGALYTQNPPNNGTLNLVGSLGTIPNGVLGFDVDGSGAAFASLNSGQLFGTVDLPTGAFTGIGPVSGFSGQVTGISVGSAAAVPEASTLSMLILGLVSFTGIHHQAALLQLKTKIK